MTEDRSTVRLSEAADEDLSRILWWTEDKFGAAQAETYGGIIRHALHRLRDGPTNARAAPRRISGRDLLILRPRLGRRTASHVLLIKVTGDHELAILRILQEKMDLPRHLPAG